MVLSKTKGLGPKSLTPVTEDRVSVQTMSPFNFDPRAAKFSFGPTEQTVDADYHLKGYTFGSSRNSGLDKDGYDDSPKSVSTVFFDSKSTASSCTPPEGIPSGFDPKSPAIDLPSDKAKEGKIDIPLFASDEDIFDVIHDFRTDVQSSDSAFIEEISSHDFQTLVILLANQNDRIRIEALFVLESVLKSSFKCERDLINLGVVPILVQMLSLSKTYITGHSANCLGLIAKRSKNLRDICLQAGALNALSLSAIASTSLPKNQSKQGKHGKRYVQAFRYFYWNDPTVRIELVAPCIPCFVHFMKSEDESLLEEVCLALFQFVELGSYQVPDRVSAVINAGVIPYIIPLLREGANKEIQAIALELLRIFSMSYSCHLKKLLEAGLLDSLAKISSDHNAHLHRKICRILLLIAAGGDASQLSRLVSYPKLKSFLSHASANSDRGLRSLAIRTICYIRIGHLYWDTDEEFVSKVCHLLGHHENIVCLALTAIKASLENGQYRIKLTLDHCGGYSKIYSLQMSKNKIVRDKAKGIIERFFNIAEEMNGSRFPNAKYEKSYLSQVHVAMKSKIEDQEMTILDLEEEMEELHNELEEAGSDKKKLVHVAMKNKMKDQKITIQDLEEEMGDLHNELEETESEKKKLRDQLIALTQQLADHERSAIEIKGVPPETAWKSFLKLSTLLSKWKASLMQASTSES